MRFASNLGTAPRIAASRSCGEASARDLYRAQVEKRPASWRQEACSHNSNNNPPGYSWTRSRKHNHRRVGESRLRRGCLDPGAPTQHADKIPPAACRFTKRRRVLEVER